MRTIVVGTDGSESAWGAVDQAIDLAATIGARLEVVSAYQPVPEARLRVERKDVPDEYQWMINPREDVDAVLAETVEAAGERGVEASPHSVEGSAAEVLLDVAEQTGAELIVVGNKGMTGGRRFLLGSVPNRVSHHAGCNVLIARTT